MIPTVPTIATGMVPQITASIPLIAPAEVPKFEARGWRDAVESARSKAREAGARGRRKGQEAGQRAMDDADVGSSSPVPYFQERDVITRPTVSTPVLAKPPTTALDAALITAAPKIEARGWKDAVEAARSKVREAGARGRQQGEEARRKGQNAGADAAGWTEEEQVEEGIDWDAYQAWGAVGRKLASVVGDWRSDLSSAQSIGASYRSYASSITASARAKGNNGADTTLTGPKRRQGPTPTSPPASPPTEALVNSAEFPPITLARPLAAGMGVIAAVFIIF